MKSWARLFAAALLSSQPLIAQMYVTCDLSGSDYQLSTHASAEYRSGSFDVDYNAHIFMDHSITGPQSNHKYTSGWGSVQSTSGMIPFWSGDTLQAGCYRANASASASKNGYTVGDQSAGSQAYCVSNSYPPPSSPPSQCGGNTDYTSGCSPIVINFERGNYALSGANDPVTFDIAASGTPLRIGWTARGADEAFLALDRDHNGRIDNGAELFGTATPLKDGRPANNGFDVLAEFDDNGDGAISADDAIWFRLLLWRDSNHDGVSQSSELSSIVRSTVDRIGTRYHWTGRRDEYGNHFKYESQLWMRNPGGRVAVRPVYDIFFVVVR